MIGEILVRLREKKKLTQDQVANDLNIKRARYSSWENNIASPGLEYLKVLAKYFGVSLDNLAGESILELPFVTRKSFKNFMEYYFPKIIMYLTANMKILSEEEKASAKKIGDIVQNQSSFDLMDSWQQQELVKALFEIVDSDLPIIVPKFILPDETLKEIPNSHFFLKSISENITPLEFKPYTKIPVLGEIVAGLPLEAHEDILGYEDIPIELAKNGEYFGLKVKGDSMEPRIKKGDILIIKKQPDIDSGDIGIVLINGESATVKQIHKAETGITLQAWNTAYPTKFYSNKEIETLPVMILGKVVEFRGKI
ncbi:MAG: XRE family transcriptional regulator [Dehalobacter sp.]|nr:XRE family transcriptional regulator [Dehalobacter sp.]